MRTRRTPLTLAGAAAWKRSKAPSNKSTSFGDFQRSTRPRAGDFILYRPFFGSGVPARQAERHTNFLLSLATWRRGIRFPKSAGRNDILRVSLAPWRSVTGNSYRPGPLVQDGDSRLTSRFRRAAYTYRPVSRQCLGARNGLPLRAAIPVPSGSNSAEGDPMSGRCDQPL